MRNGQQGCARGKSAAWGWRKIEEENKKAVGEKTADFTRVWQVRI